MKQRRRILLIAGALFLLGYVAFGLSRIRFDVDVVRLLPEGLKEAEATRLFLEHFAKEGELIVTVHGDDPKAVDEAADSLALAFESENGLVASVKSKPPLADNDEKPEEEIESGSEMLELLAWILANQPTEDLKALAASLAPGKVEAKLEASMQDLADGMNIGQSSFGYDPLGLLGDLAEMQRNLGTSSAFVSEDGTLRIIYVQSTNPEGSYRDKIAWIDDMWQLVDRWKAQQDKFLLAQAEIGFTGSPAFVAEVSSGMEGDMQFSGTCTLLVISLIFWLAYRRVRPLLDLVLALLVVFVLTLATGGILFRELSAISIGFASILIGLTVDYAVILYQKARSTGGSVQDLRKAAGRGILWASLTTAAAFAALAAGRIPGLSELGLLVGAGVLIGAAVMLGGFVYRASSAGKRERSNGPEMIQPTAISHPGRIETVATWGTVTLLVGLIGYFAVMGLPEMDGTTAALRPKKSEAQKTLNLFIDKLDRTRGKTRIILEGETLTELKRLALKLEGELAKLEDEGLLKDFSVPTRYLPVSSIQNGNLLGPCSDIVAERQRLSQAVSDAGFSEEAFGLADSILDYWATWAEDTELYSLTWPEGKEVQNIVARIMVWKPKREGPQAWALGEILPAYKSLDSTDSENVRESNLELLSQIRKRLDIEGIYLGGGRVLGIALSEVVPGSIWRIFIMLSALVLIALGFAFRNVREVLLTVVSVAVTIGAMMGAMKLFGLMWNFMNLAALLLALGAGLDYAIHIIIDLRRTGCVVQVRRGVGRALLICGLSSVAGFGSLAWAGNYGLASLGQACAIALALNTLVAVFLLPKAWARTCGPNRIGKTSPS